MILFMISALLFVAGLVFVIKGADFLVNGASSLAKRIHVSELVIGLTIVAFGTSMPELTVNLFASFNGQVDIAIGNILGSNIANILLILGITAMIHPLRVSKGTAWKEIPFSLLAALVLGLMANDFLIDGAGASVLSRIDGLVLIGFFIIFLYYVFGIARISAPDPEESSAPAPQHTVQVAVGLILLAPHYQSSPPRS
jgi:cation:H+ antiporter